MTLLQKAIQQANRRRVMGIDKGKINKEVRSYSVDKHDRKLKRVCEECGGFNKVKLVKSVRKRLCENCCNNLK